MSHTRDLQNYFRECCISFKSIKVVAFAITANDRALCRCGIRIPSARNRCPVFDKDKYLEPMFGDVGQARTNAAMLLIPIDTTQAALAQNPLLAVGFLLINKDFSMSLLLLAIQKVSCQVSFLLLLLLHFPK